jgi:hypothetical protein
VRVVYRRVNGSADSDAISSHRVSCTVRLQKRYTIYRESREYLYSSSKTRGFPILLMYTKWREYANHYQSFIQPPNPHQSTCLSSRFVSRNAVSQSHCRVLNMPKSPVSLRVQPIAQVEKNVRRECSLNGIRSPHYTKLADTTLYNSLCY